MATVSESKTTATPSKSVPWLPLAVLPAVVGMLCAGWPAWAFMWMLAGAVFAGLKWLTFADAPVARRTSAGRCLGYLFLWPGMNARAFFGLGNGRVESLIGPRLGEWWSALGKTVCGCLLVFVVPALVVERLPLLAGWLGGVGIVVLLHFGVFHLLSLGWRHAGIDAPAIMQAPMRSTSLAEFWGRRWNLAFRDLAHAYVFRPLLRTLGAGGATMAVFLVSGLVHDLVISVPAGAGFGLPTLYFVIQGVGILFERGRFAKRLGLGEGVRGWLFCAAVTIGPVCLLFHRPFVERVVLPMLAAIGGL